MKQSLFNTEIEETDENIIGPFRQPRQMLAAQSYDGHKSIHDDSQARDLGFSGAPIEGPTHFSQFEPLLYGIWGNRWLECGCISAHFKNVVVEGEEVQAFVQKPAADANITRVWAVKRTGELVLEGTASIGPDHPDSELDKLLASRPTPEQLVILENIVIGEKAANAAPVHMHADQHMGNSYPFSLIDKLKVITELCPWYSADSAGDCPWGRAIIPMEMISPLVAYSFNEVVRHVKRPVIGLFADLEIRLIKGPLFVGKEYELEKEIVGLGESRRTESMWIKTSIIDPESAEVVATTLLNSASLKTSYQKYAEEAARLGKTL